MSNVIDFLEKWGQDSQLRHAASAELEQANGTVTYEITVIPIDGLPKTATVNPKTRQLGG